MHTHDGQNYVTLASEPGTLLKNCTCVDSPPPDNAPEDLVFQYGFFEFTVVGVAAPGDTTVTLYLPPGDTPTTYYKYGPTPNDPVKHWYEFLYNGQTGAEINGNVVVLHFVDEIGRAHV